MERRVWTQVSRCDGLFCISATLHLCLNGNILNGSFYSSCFEAHRDNELWRLFSTTNHWLSLSLSFSLFPPLSSLVCFSLSSASCLFLSSQMSVEGDDKRTRTRSKGIRGERRQRLSTLSSFLQLLNTHSVTLIHILTSSAHLLELTDYLVLFACIAYVPCRRVYAKFSLGSSCFCPCVFLDNSDMFNGS